MSESYYLQLAEMGADVKVLKEMSPTDRQLEELMDGLLKIMAGGKNRPIIK